MVYKRWKGKKIKPGDPNFDKARWWIEYRLQGRRVHKAVPEARTKAQAERADRQPHAQERDPRIGKSLRELLDEVARRRCGGRLAHQPAEKRVPGLR